MHILFIRHSLKNTSRIEQLLSESFAAPHTITPHTITPHTITLASDLKSAAMSSVDLILLGIGADEADHVAILDTLRSQKFSTPIVLVTDAQEEEDKRALEALSAGAQDFLVIEELNARLLRRALQCAVARENIHQKLQSGSAQRAALLDNSLDCIISMDSQGEVVEWNQAAERVFGYQRQEVLGQELASLIIPERLRKAHHAGLKKYLASGIGPVLDQRIEIEALRRDGSEFPVELSISAAHSQTDVAFNAYLRDISERKYADQQLLQRTRLAALGAEIGVALTQKASLREILQQCSEAIIKHLDAYFARIWTMDRAGEILELQASAGQYTHLNGLHSRIPVGHLKIGLIAQERQAHLTNSVWDDPRVSDKEWARREGVVAFAGHPLVVEDRVVGVVALFARKALSEDSLQALASIADSIALGIERKQTEETLRMNKIIIDQTSTGFVVSDPRQKDCPLIFVNPAFERITGYSPAESLGKNCRFLQGPDTDEEAIATLRSAVESSQECHITLKNYQKDGTAFWNDLHISPIFDSAGTLTYFVGIQNDITQRILKEKEQEHLADYNRLLLQSTGEGIYGVDLQGNCTFLNEAGGRILQTNPEDVIGQNMHELTHFLRVDGSPYPQEDCPILRAFTTGVGCRIDNEVFQRLDGSVFPVEYSSFPIFEDGIVRGAVVTFADITERREIQEKLQASEARYQRIAANVPGMVYQFVMRTDGSFAFPFVSEFSRELYGLEPQAIVAEPMLLIDIVHPDDRPGFDKSIEESARLLQPWKWSGRFLHKSGEYRWVEGASRPKKEENGDILWDGLLVDITNRKKTEVELLEAKEAAEAATIAKSQFLATMSHEIRTPMNAVIGMTGLLLDTGLNAEQTEYAEIIRDSGDALLTVINDILDYSKIEADQLELERHPVALRQVVESSLDLLATRAAEKEIELAYVIEPDTPLAVLGDETRLRQIIVNLLSNAVKFTERGEVVLTLSSKPLTLNHYELQFDVRDTGIGIPEDRMDRLFRSFSQVDASTTRRYGGTGLGLVICQRLTKMMGGSIWVESEVGKGSIFHVAIPMEATEAVSTSIEISPPHLEGRRILIVDDNPTNRQILQLQARSWGMESLETANGQEALRLLQEGENFDIAILDIQMPEMDGITLAREIRRYRGPEELPLIGLSSVTRRLSETENVGFATMLTKPIKQSQLYNVLAEVFTALPHEAQPVQPASPYDSTLGQRMPLRVLIAEDLVINQKLLLILLEKFGYRADVAANGIEAVTAVERQPYDVILMDVQMPEMDGLEASREIIKRIPAERRPRIIALTANAMREDQETCLAAGMDDYLSKPVNPRALQAALIRSSERSRNRKTTDSYQQDSLLSDTQISKPNRGSSTAKPPVPADIDVLLLTSLQDSLPELTEVFRAEGETCIVEMRMALSNSDPHQMMEAAHGLKGIASNMGGRGLAAHCAQLEKLGKSGTLDGATFLLSEVESLFLQFCTTLAERKNQL